MGSENSSHPAQKLICSFQKPCNYSKQRNRKSERDRNSERESKQTSESIRWGGGREKSYSLEKVCFRGNSGSFTTPTPQKTGQPFAVIGEQASQKKYNSPLGGSGLGGIFFFGGRAGVSALVLKGSSENPAPPKEENGSEAGGCMRKICI